MALNPIHDPMTHVGAMLDQLVRQNQTLVAYIDRIVTTQHETTQDLRVYRRSTEAAIEQLRVRIDQRIGDLRADMNEGFAAVALRFDKLDARTERVDRTTQELRSDMLRLENGVLNAQQSALQAHLRRDDERGAGTPDAPPL